MMYGNKLAAAIKVNGKVLREFKDEVYVPFGCEYAITLKNLNTTRCVVNVFIDGDNMVPGGLVLNAGQSIDLERSIKNNNLTEGNKFKFIERTEAVENGPRGIKVEDGLVRIEYQFEIPLPVFNRPWISASGSSGSIYPQGGLLRSSTGDSPWPSGSVTCSASLNSFSAQASNVSMDASFSDVGITVPGSKSTQSFQTAYVGALESTTHNLVFKLVGDLGFNKPVTKPVTVKHKPKCVTCGKQNKHNAKFCAECGTALEIFA